MSKEQNKIGNVIAGWVVELNCDCPACGNHIDLLDYPDFWESRNLDVAETGTERSKNVEVVCPQCFSDFSVDCEY